MDHSILIEVRQKAQQLHFDDLDKDDLSTIQKGSCRHS